MNIWYLAKEQEVKAPGAGHNSQKGIVLGSENLRSHM